MVRFLAIDRFVQQSSIPYLQCGMVEPILRCAIAACSLDHKEANASVMKYLSDFLMCATKKEVGTSKAFYFTDIVVNLSRIQRRRLYYRL